MPKYSTNESSETMPGKVRKRKNWWEVPAPNEEELREQYARTCLPKMGIPFEDGIDIPGVRITLVGAVGAKRRMMAAKASQHP